MTNCILLADHFRITPNEFLAHAGWPTLKAFDTQAISQEQLPPEVVAVTLSLTKITNPGTRKDTATAFLTLINKCIDPGELHSLIICFFIKTENLYKEWITGHFPAPSKTGTWFISFSFASCNTSDSYVKYKGIRCIKEIYMNIKGSLPLLILQVLTDGPNHGYSIAQQIKRQSQGVLDFKEGTLYPALHSLEQQGLLSAYSEEENGRTRRYYQITPNGRKRLEHERKEWNQFVQAVNLTLGEVS